MTEDLEQMEADLSDIVVHRSIAHAENILVMLRHHEAAGLSHETSIRLIHAQVMDG